jgi:hypothetical protein
LFDHPNILGLYNDYHIILSLQDLSKLRIKFMNELNLISIS